MGQMMAYGHRGARVAWACPPLHDPADSKSVKELTNMTAKIQLKLHFLPFISLKLVRDLSHQLYHVLELHKYSNFD